MGAQAKANKGDGAAAAPPMDPEAVRQIIRQEFGDSGRPIVTRDPGVQARRGMLVRVRRAQGDYGEIKMELGRVFKLSGLLPRRDEQLVRIGWVELHSGPTFACRVCGGEFASEATRTNHGDTIHAKRPASGVREVPLPPPSSRERTTYGEDAIAEERALQAAAARAIQTEEEGQERRLEQEAPLYLDKTAASQK